MAGLDPAEVRRRFFGVVYRRGCPGPTLPEHGRRYSNVLSAPDQTSHRHPPFALDLGAGAVEDVADALGLVLAPAALVQSECGAQRLHRLQYLFRRTHAAHGACHDAHAVQHALDRGRIILQRLASRLGDREQLLAAFGRGRFDLAHVLEQAEDRVDRARARRIGAADQLLDRFDQLVTVARLLADQPQQQRAQIARTEKASAATAAELLAAAAPATFEQAVPAAMPAETVLAFAEPDVAIVLEAAPAAMVAAAAPAALFMAVMLAAMAIAAPAALFVVATAAAMIPAARVVVFMPAAMAETAVMIVSHLI